MNVLPVLQAYAVLIIVQLILMVKIVRRNVNANMALVIQLMGRVDAPKAGMEHCAMSECAQIICLAKIVHRFVNAIKITRICVIHGRENVIVKPAGAVAFVIDHAHS